MNSSSESSVSEFKELIRIQLNQGTAPAAIQGLLEAEFNGQFKLDFYASVLKLLAGTTVLPLGHQTDLATLKGLLGV